MLNFSAYIEYLLMTRHYCYVPGRGAYMLADNEASPENIPSIGAQSNRFYTLHAPIRRVIFSPLHSHDDGILANLLMEAEGMSYDEACRYIARQVPLLPTDFVDKAWYDTDTENFGFESIELETWHDIEKRLNPSVPVAPAVIPKVSVSSDTITIPRVWLQRAAMVALVVVFFFTNFIGLHNGDAQLASIIDTNILQHNAHILHGNCADDDEYADDIVAEQTEDNALAAETDPSMTDEAAVTVKASGKRYYIIIASSYSESEANAVCQRYAKQGFSHLGILIKNNLFRVFTESFDRQDEAISYLRQLRTSSPKLEKSWMLPVEADQSLSYIIKDIYNDNQLSMELSHPNQRTERDQG